MSDLIKVTSQIFAVLAYIQIPVMIFLDKVSDDYWADLWNPKANMENRAGGILILLSLSFVLTCVNEFYEHFAGKN